MSVFSLRFHKKLIKDVVSNVYVFFFLFMSSHHIINKHLFKEMTRFIVRLEWEVSE